MDYQDVRGKVEGQLGFLYVWEIELTGRPTPDVCRAQGKRINGGLIPNDHICKGYKSQGRSLDKICFILS